MKQKQQTPAPMPIDKGNGHTPGQWEIVPTDEIYPYTLMIAVKNSKSGKFSIPICDVHSHLERKEQTANAKLIASAPQLLKDNKAKDETIRELLEALTDLKERAEKARAILQSESSPNKGFWGVLDTQTAAATIEKAIAKHNQ